MSVTSKNSSHRRKDSGELVVFDAARYFSGAYENPGHHSSSAVFPQHSAGKGGGRALATAGMSRMSLDIPAIGLPTIQKQYMTKEKKKYKQPSSPGARLASFLNSLFNQTNSKKKKKTKTNSDDVGDHDHPVHRRRSSISHFIITENCDSNFTFPAAETAPSCAKTPTKSSYIDLKSFSGRRKEISLNRNNGSFRDFPKKWTADNEDRREFGRFGDVDEGEDSDSSSDLFDLPNLDYDSSGLPVYGTTNMGRIRVEAPICSDTTV